MQRVASASEETSECARESLASARTVLGAMTQLYLSFGVQNGVQPEALCAAAGISPGDVADRHAQVPYAWHRAVHDALFEHVQQDSGSVELGMLGATLEHFGYVGLAIKSAATPLAAIQLLVDSVALMDTGYQHHRPRLCVGETQATLTVPVLAQGEEPPPDGMESVFVILVEALRSRDGQRAEPREVQFAHARAPGVQRQLEAYFQAHVSFERAQHGIVWDNAVMRRQSLHANVHAAPHFARQVGSLLDRQHHPLQVEVSRQIKELLARRDLTQATVAGLLGMSARTLQRQLRSLGVSYQQLLADERQAAAKRLLSDRSLSIYQVAHELGYEEVSAFYRAFRLWTGLSPSAYRRHLV